MKNKGKKSLVQEFVQNVSFGRRSVGVNTYVMSNGAYLLPP